MTLEQSVIAEFAIKIALSYLLGSLVGALLIGRLRGVDIRQLGSGNAGGTNALRTQGRAFAFWVMVIDIGKGWLAAGPLARLRIPGISHRHVMYAVVTLRGGTGADAGYQERLVSQDMSHWFDTVPYGWLAAACGIAAVVGHVYPIFYGFRGGKGVATLIGAVLGLNPLLIIPMLLIWLLAVLLFGFVGLASILGTVALAVTAVVGVLAQHLPVLTLFALGVVGSQWYLFAFGVVATVLIAFTHRSNIARMRSGTEPRARRLWLFASRSGGA